MKILEKPLIKNIWEMNNFYFKTIVNEKKLIILAIDSKNIEQTNIIDLFKDINTDYKLLVVDINEFDWQTFILNFDTIVAPSLFVFHNWNPDSSILGPKQIKQFINILKYKK